MRCNCRAVVTICMEITVPRGEAPEPSQEVASPPLCKVPLYTASSQREERSVLHTQKYPSEKKSKELKIVNS